MRLLLACREGMLSEGVRMMFECLLYPLGVGCGIR